MYGSQGWLSAAQLPVAQVPADVCVDVPTGQTSVEHMVAGAKLWQEPVPSHRPFVEQAPAPRFGQRLRGSGAPAPAGVHVPFEPGSAQETQEPVQAESQQTPSTQLPKAHWLGAAALQTSPFIFLATQVPPAPLQ